MDSNSRPPQDAAGGAGPIRVGTSGYAYPEWADAGFYPPGTRPGKMLPLYAQRFAAAELNYTWYQMPKAPAIDRMRRQVPPGFAFALKLTRTMTHEVDRGHGRPIPPRSGVFQQPCPGPGRGQRPAADGAAGRAGPDGEGVVDRHVIHINVADFAVAVERTVDRRLRERPVIVAPEGVSRAVVYDMSEEAYQAGVRKGMALRRAVRLCADVRILPPRPARYEQAMQALIRQALSYSPLIEPGEADGHLFVDVTGSGRLFGPPADVAWRLRRQARAELGLKPVWAVAPNKLVAKVATRLVKPDGEFIVPAGEEGRFLAPVPLHLIPGIDRRDLACLGDFNLRLAGQVAALGAEALQVPFGRRAVGLHEAVQGIDRSPVRPVGQTPPCVVVDHDFDEDAQRAPVIEGALYALVEKAGRDLRRRCLAARRVAVVLDFCDGRRCARQGSVRPASGNDLVLFEQACAALDLAWRRRVRIRHLRLVCDRLVFPPAQQELFPAQAGRDRRRAGLVSALDSIRERFGPDAIRVGRTLAVTTS